MVNKIKYATLADVPLPNYGSGGVWDPKIVPLVKAVNVQGIITATSCEGHLDLYKPYPWVQFFPNAGNDLGLLQFLVDAYNSRQENIAGKVSGVLETERKARDEAELRMLQESAIGLAQFLFEYRPETLDSKYNDMIFLPDMNRPEYKRIDGRIHEIYNLAIGINARKITSEEFLELQELLRKERTPGEISGDVLELPITKEQTIRWIKEAKKRLLV